MERVLLLYRDARGTDTSVAPHVKVILDNGSFTWDSMHNTYGVPANADGDSTITFIAFWSGIYRKCYYDQSHNLHGSAVSANAEYYDEAALGFYKFTSTSKKIQIFPYVPFNDTQGNQIEIHEFTYSAKRMDKSPTLTATFNDYDCYDKKWNTNDEDQKKVQRYYNIFTIFNDERYYLKTTPTSQYSNTDARYKHNLVFLSEREILEHTIMFDSVHTTYPVFDTSTAYAVNAIVQYGALYYQFITAHSAGPWDITQVTQLTGVTSPVSESAEFSFYGTAIDLANRINGVLIQSGITTYDQSSDTYDGYHVVFDYYPTFSTSEDYNVDDIVVYNGQYYIFTQKHTHGSWNSSHVQPYTLQGIAISFDKETIYDALQKFNTDFDMMYYFDGKTIYVKEYQNVVADTIQQGVNDALLSIEKQNKDSELVSRMTAVGSEDNIPYFYPNPTEDGFLKPIYQRDGSTIQSVTAAKNDNFENSFYKNRSKFVFKNARVSDTSPYASSEVFVNKLQDAGSGVVIHLYMKFQVTDGMIDNGMSYIPIMYVNNDPFLQYIALPVEITQSTAASATPVYSWTDSSIIDKITNQEVVLFPCSSTGTYYLKMILRYQHGNPPSAIQYNGQIVTIISGYYYAPVVLNDDEIILDYFYSRNDLQYIGSQYAYMNDAGEYIPVSPMACLYVDPDNPSRNVVYRDLSTGKYYRYDPYLTIAGIRPTGARFAEVSASSSELTGPQYANTYIVGKTSHRSYNKGWRLFNSGKQTDVGDTSNLNRIDDYGIIITGTVRFFDEIHFLVEKYLQPQPRLMPELYQKTDGARRFYDATQYPIRGQAVYSHTVDEDTGEYLTSDGANPIISNHYYEDTGGNYMVIENPYEQGNKKEYIGEYDDIKPTLKGAKIKIGNDGNYSSTGTLKPIDVFLEFAYDLYDSDEMIEVTGNENDQLAYQHPYFFAKLRPLGFNLFDMAIDEGEMIVNFTTGHCGSCEFKVMVGEKFKQNTVRIWPYDAFYYNESGVLTYAYHAGDLMRYDNRDLYREASGGTYELITDLGLKDITTNNVQTLNGLEISANSNSQRTFRTWGDVICTDIVVSSVEETQKDTTNTPTWICLMKDVSTFNTIMPSTMRLLAPQSVASAGSDDAADKFVFTHIKMPQTYVRNAEIELTKQLIKDLVLMNTEQWAFTIKFSRIYYAENTAIVSLINENTLFKSVLYDGITYKLSVGNFTYKVQGADALPEITVQIEDLKNSIRYRKHVGGITPWNPWDSWIIQREEDEPSGNDVRIRNTVNRLNVIGSTVSELNLLTQILSLSKTNNDNFVAINYLSDQTKRQAIRLELNQGYPEFSTSVAYLKDTVVKKDGLLYRFTSNKSAGAWDSSKVTQTNIGDEDGISRQVGKDADTKASNILTDLGFEVFDSTRSYSANEIVVYNNRLYRFTANKSAGVWDVSKVAQDSVINCVYLALGIEEYNENRTTYLEVDDNFFRNGKAYRVTKRFKPSTATTEIFTRSTEQYDITGSMAVASEAAALRQTVETLRGTVNALNTQVLDSEKGLAVSVRSVNQKIADLTSAMNTENTTTRAYVSALAKALAENEVLQNDATIVDASGTLTDYLDQTSAVSTAAQAAYTELTGADDDSVYNEMVAVYAKEMFGAAVGVVHSAFSDKDSEYKFTKMVYDNSQYMPNDKNAFVEFDGNNNYEQGYRVIYNKHLYIFTSAYESSEQGKEWNPSIVENIDDYLIKAVFLSTDAYNTTSGSDFLEYGRFLDANTFCDHIYELVIKCGEAGIIYTELQKVVGEECKELVDGNDLNMITEHVWAAGGYTVLQYASLRLEMNDKIYVAAIYKEDYTRDDAHHILFDIKYIESMTVKTNDTIKDNGKTAEYNGEMYFVLTRDELAKTIGDNYLYCADYEVDENILLFLSSIEVDGTTLYNCYLLKQE